MNRKKTMKDINVKGKHCLVRVDFNVPMDKKGNITDETRIQNTLPTIHNLIGRGAKIILVSHLGRPVGKDKNFSLKLVSKKVAELLGQKNIPVYDIDHKNTAQAVKDMKNGDIIFFENVRYYYEERKDHINFGKRLAEFGDIFINDAFGTAHRVHGSTVGITKFLPSVQGLLMEQETKLLTLLIDNPNHPLVAVIGGKKTSTKLPVINVLLDKADYIILGGGVANTFFKTWGYDIGDSCYEEGMMATAKKIIWKAIQSRAALILPHDVVVADKMSSRADIREVPISKIPKGFSIFDAGSKSRKKYRNILKNAGSVLWSGPIGVFEIEQFSHGTNTVLAAIASSNANSVIGGGDTIAAIAGSPDMNRISHISTGGGATLEFIEKGTLPGIEALNDY